MSGTRVNAALAYCSTAGPQHVAPAHRRPERGCYSTAPNDLFPVNQVYEYGKIKLRAHEFAHALELFEQCDRMLLSVQVSPAYYRNLDEYKRNCKTYLEMLGNGLVEDDSSLAKYRSLVRAILPGLDPRVERRYSATFSKLGVDSMETLAALGRDELHDLSAHFPTGHRAALRAHVAGLNHTAVNPCDALLGVLERLVPVVEVVKQLFDRKEKEGSKK